MNCEEFRRKLLEDPRCRDPEFLAHRAECGPCDDEAGKVMRLESDLENLLNVEPPPDLKDNLRQVPRQRRWVPTALAASLAGAVALGAAWWMGGAEQGGDAAIVAEVLHHIEHEPEAFATQVAMPAGSWAAMSPRVQVDTQDWQYTVTYAAPCIVMDRKGLHLVLAGDEGPVTVLVIVDQEVADPRLFHEEQYRGVVRPLGHGTLAVVTGGSRSVDTMAAELALRIRIIS